VQRRLSNRLHDDDNLWGFQKGNVFDLHSFGVKESENNWCILRENRLRDVQGQMVDHHVQPKTIDSRRSTRYVDCNISVSIIKVAWITDEILHRSTFRADAQL
jgi:hypothetical protein